MAKRKKAIENLRKLEQAQHKLIAEMNKLIQQAKKEGYTTKVSPQALRLAGLREYRTRDFAKINSLLDSPELLKNNVAVIDADTGEIIRGGEALERYARYQSSGIYHASTPLVSTALFGEEIPSEAERTLTNFAETVQEAFPDDSVYQRFVNYLDRAIGQDTTIADDSFWKLSHDTINTYKSGHPKTARGVQSSKSYWMFENRDKIHEINSALARLINLEGERSVIERLRDAGETIIEDVIVAAIGYNESSSRAVQSILNVLLPSSIKNRAMAMGDVADIADDFEGFEE